LRVPLRGGKRSSEKRREKKLASRKQSQVKRGRKKGSVNTPGPGKKGLDVRQGGRKTKKKNDQIHKLAGEKEKKGKRTCMALQKRVE